MNLHSITGPRRPYFLTAQERNEAIDRIDGLGVRPLQRSELEYPVGPQYEKGEEIQRPKREKAREMPLMELCRRIAAIMALIMITATGLGAREQAMPILSMHTDRIGAYDVLTTVQIVPSAENMAVCVGLSGEHYHARWGCDFVKDARSTSVTIHWQDVPHEDYALEAGLWRAKRPTLAGAKVSLTYRRAFGVVRI